MASVLQVATIKDQGGNNNAIEIANSSANVTINNLAGGTIGSNVTFPSGMVTNVLHFWTTGNEYSNQSTTLKAMVTSNSFSAISGKKYYLITSFNVWPYKTSTSDNNWLTEWHLYTGTTSRTEGTTTFTGDTDQGKVRIGKYHTVNATSGLNGYQSVTLQGSLTAASTTTYYFHIVSKGLNTNTVTRIKADQNHPWRTTIFEVQP